MVSLSRLLIKMSYEVHNIVGYSLDLCVITTWSPWSIADAWTHPSAGDLEYLNALELLGL